MRDHEEFTRLARTFQDTVYRVAYGYLRNPQDAEDAAQNALLKLLRSDTAFADDDHAKFWLIHVTLNECRRLAMAPWRRELPLEKLTQTLTFPSPAHSELFCQVMTLPKKYRVPVLLYYYEGYTTAEIGQMLGLSPAAVRTRLARARKKLKTMLQEQEDFL